MLRCRWLAILPPSRLYDLELPSTARQMVVYLAFQSPLPPHGHALRIFVTHSLHLYSNLLFLYLLDRPVLGPVLDYISLVWTDVRSASIRLSRSPAPPWEASVISVFCEQSYASALEVVLSRFL